MFERFRKDSRAIVLDAMKEARDPGETRGSRPSISCSRSLGDRRGTRGGSWPRRASTTTVSGRHSTMRSGTRSKPWGSGSGATWIPDSTLPVAGQPRWGESAKMALRRATIAAKDRGDRQLTPTHILIGVLRAREGTVPRALAAAGVDPAELAAHAEATLS